MEKWVELCCKKDIKYGQPPPRKENKFSRLRSSHNQTGANNEFLKCRSDEEVLFHKLQVKSHKMVETYLVTFLSSWLCIFVFPTKACLFIRPCVFRNACHLSCGRRVSLGLQFYQTFERV